MQVSKLYVIATPIGNLEDLSPRAIKVLQSCDIILAEDTRHSQKLLQHFAIHTPLQSCYEHNEREKSIEVVEGLQAGKAYALISDAGTPVFSDPGAKLIAKVLEAGFQVVPIPGACAAIAALSASGLSGIPFHFYGFLPVQSGQKQKILNDLRKNIVGTLGFYESPHRLMDTLADFQIVFGEMHELVIAKELTKVYEAIHKAPIRQIIAWFKEDEKRCQGEFVLLLENKVEKDLIKLELTLDALLTQFMLHLKLKEAVNTIVELTGLPKNQVYERALALKKERE